MLIDLCAGYGSMEAAALKLGMEYIAVDKDVLGRFRDRAKEVKR